MTVILRTDKSGTRKGFLANFTTGYNLRACTVEEHQCGNGKCIPLNNLCDNKRDCEDGSDEAKCMRLLNGSLITEGLLEARIGKTWHLACADDWNEDISDSVCQLLGLGDANTSSTVLFNGDGPFVNITQGANHSLIFTKKRQLKPSRWQAVLGLYAQSDLTEPSTVVRNIDRIIMNPHYMKETKDSDIALMHLQHKVQYTAIWSLWHGDLLVLLKPNEELTHKIVLVLLSPSKPSPGAVTLAGFIQKDECVEA
ncbi:enteropeptidase-like protein [Willisornis vidua]|uniref:Enteropeptidase-like protein n=1 Tax=Willisornis vidua TaxID=1566151 RepID=A0ABQ9DEK7_9PASS|nr:enteropeptidase-like protein [Willisornis vidua]